MNLKKLLAYTFLPVTLFSTNIINAQDKKDIIVAVNKPVAEVQPTMWGIFFEDINFGADGGINAELIKNRSFEFSMPLMGWTVQKNYFNEGAALDLIEFANGDANTTWGKVRASMGHPAPFNLKMMGVGNENWGPQYIDRLKIFEKAIKSKYANFKLVVSSGTDPNGERFDYLNDEVRKLHADLIDEHYYRRPEWFLANSARYDDYPRNGSKIFAGEYAAQSDHTVSINNENNMATAICEAAFMTGLERNAAVVNMASYAPLFAHDVAWQWTPHLIWVNNIKSYGTTDYYVQKLFSTNKGTNVVTALRNGKPLTGQDSLYVSAVIDTKSNDVIVKVVNASGEAQTNKFRLDGLKKKNSTGDVTTLKSDDLTSMNSFSAPKNVAPQQSTLSIEENIINFNSQPYSFSVIRIKM